MSRGHDEGWMPRWFLMKKKIGNEAERLRGPKLAGRVAGGGGGSGEGGGD